MIELIELFFVGFNCGGDLNESGNGVRGGVGGLQQQDRLQSAQEMWKSDDVHACVGHAPHAPHAPPPPPPYPKELACGTGNN